MLRGELGHPPLRVLQLLGLDGDVGCLTAQTGEWLVHHDARIWQRVALASGAGGEQELAHAGGHAHADGGDVAADELHCVVNRHASGDRTTGAIDVQPNVGLIVLALQVEELGADLVGDVVVDIGAEHDDSVVQ